jgi:hypothetical protein
MSKGVLATMASIVAACSSSTSPHNESPLQLTMTAPSRVIVGDSAVLTFSLKNGATTVYNARFPGSPERPHLSVVVLTQVGDTLWYHAGGNMLQIASRSFAPNESVQRTLSWPLQNRAGGLVGAGTYRVRATIETFDTSSSLPIVVRSQESAILVASQ